MWLIIFSCIIKVFVQVELGIMSKPLAEAPAEALVVRNGKTLVAVVGEDERVRFRPVSVSGNDGRMVTFAGGVQPGERVALSLGSAVADGARIQREAVPSVHAAATPAPTAR